MAGPCLADTNCIALNQNGNGEIEATPIISPDAGNTLQCRANGLFAAMPGATLYTATTAASAPFTVTAVAPNDNIVQTGTFTVTNPSATRNARYIVIADLGSVEFFAVPPTNIPVSLVRTATLPNALALRHRFKISQYVGATYMMEDAACPEFFSGSLGPGASVQVQVQRAVHRLVAGSGVVQGIVGQINWIGLVVPA
jgi:hypothetical protein